MKKHFNIILMVVIIFVSLLSCTKEVQENIIDTNDKEDGDVQVEYVTISASLSDDITKVAFVPTYEDGQPVKMSLTWEEGDKLRIYNHDDRSKYDDVTLHEDYIGQKNGIFNGPVSNIIGATKYDIEVLSEDFTYSSQTQPSDGVATGLKYLASVTEVDDYSEVEFTDVSSVLAVTVKMPEGVAANVKSVDIKASENIFNGSNTLTVTLDQIGDADSDNLVQFFATLPKGTTAIPSGTTLVLHINVPETEHTVYTRFVELGSELSFVQNKLNAISVNATNCATYANASAENIGTEANPYLVGDKYQFDAMRNYLSSTMAYFEMVADIDMTGISWKPLNTTPGNCYHFEGNDHILSNVTSSGSQLYQSVFGCLSGTVQNLVVDKATMTPGDAISGVLASHLGGSATTVMSIVKNVKITNSTLGTANQKGTKQFGILAGVVENPNGAEVSDITISDCIVASDSDVGGMISTISQPTTINGTNKVLRTDVYGKLAGGVIGFANKKLTISGCTYSGGTVTVTGQYSGCFIGSAGNFDSVISDCHVQDAVLDATSVTTDLRAGGFIGRLSQKVTLKGCTLGTENNRVEVKLGTPSAAGAKINSGGFVGLAYGTITKNGDVRNKAYVKITCTNTTTSRQLNLGGFVGYHQYNTVEYCDADVQMENIKGTYVGGFCGVNVDSNIQHCTVTGTVTGNDYTGGFVGVVDAGTISYCTSSGNLTSEGASVGGFIGGSALTNADCVISNNSSSVDVTANNVAGGFVGAAVGTYTSNYATGNVKSANGNVGGFAGRIQEKCVECKFSKNYSSGYVDPGSNTANAGGLIGYVGGNLEMDNCYSTSDVGNSDSGFADKTGGLIGYTYDNTTYITEGVTITNCYSSGVVTGRSVTGGLIGRMGLSTVSVSKSVAWNEIVYSELNEADRYSSAAVVGTAYPNCTLTDNYRKPSMTLKAYWVPTDMKTFQHADVSSETPLTDKDGNMMTDTSTASGQPNYPIYPYHGKVDADKKTLSELARDVLGWSSEIWNFDGELPILK